MVISMKKIKLLLVIAITCSVVAIAITIGFLIYNPSDSSTATNPLGGKVEQLPERSDTFSADAIVAGEDSSIENGTTSLTEKNPDSQSEEDETQLTYTTIFEGNGNEAYEPSDFSWFMNADNSDVITLVYTCTNTDCAGWGILGWGATVDNEWVDGPTFCADSEYATTILYSTFTVGELKNSLGIHASSDVSYLKLDTWNGGKIISLSIGSEEREVKNAIYVPFIAPQTNTQDTTSVPTGLHDSYLTEFYADGTYDIDIASNCPTFYRCFRR